MLLLLLSLVWGQRMVMFQLASSIEAGWLTLGECYECIRQWLPVIYTMAHVRLAV